MKTENESEFDKKNVWGGKNKSIDPEQKDIDVTQSEFVGQWAEHGKLINALKSEITPLRAALDDKAKTCADLTVLLSEAKAEINLMKGNLFRHEEALKIKDDLLNVFRDEITWWKARKEAYDAEIESLKKRII